MQAPGPCSMYSVKECVMDFNEDFIQYIWKHRLFRLPLHGQDGEEIELLDPGIHNKDAGPDFFNAKIKISNTVWVGNVEVHQRASDWDRHGHQKDPAYDNVILHVVTEDDCRVNNSRQEEVPSAILTFPGELYQRYMQLLNNKNQIKCGQNIRSIDPALCNLWLGRLAIERLEQKTREIRKILIETKGDWAETVFRVLVKSFGSHINTLPFELLGKSITYKILIKNVKQSAQLEALFFGQAGFLTGKGEDPYKDYLYSEYSYLAGKYKLRPVSSSIWKFLRLRPANFPTIRLAQLAGLFYEHPGIISRVTEICNLKDAGELLEASVSPYWEEHYNFGRKSDKCRKTIGEDLRQTIIINAVVPLQYMHALHTGNDRYRNLSVSLLESLPQERNSIIASWETCGIIPENALISQALLQLKNDYCCFRKCLNCQIGSLIIR